MDLSISINTMTNRSEPAGAIFGTFFSPFVVQIQTVILIEKIQYERSPNPFYFKY